MLLGELEDGHLGDYGRDSRSRSAQPIEITQTGHDIVLENSLPTVMFSVTVLSHAVLVGELGPVFPSTPGARLVALAEDSVFHSEPLQDA